MQDDEAGDPGRDDEVLDPTAGGPTVPPAAPGWAAPGAGDEPTASLPPTGPPTPSPYSAGPPTASFPPAPGAWGAPAAPGPAGQWAAPVPAPAHPAPQKKSRAGLVAALLVVALLLVGGVVAAALVLTGSGSLEIAVDSCEIAADGTLTATGTVSGPNGQGADVEVEFTDTANGDLVDSARISVDLSFGGIGGDAWTASGEASADVQQVTCTATATT